MTLSLGLYNSSALRAIERLVTQGHSGYALMCRAGETALWVLQNDWPEAKSLIVCCGPGNNGGDGLVLARLAKAKGYQVTVYQVGYPDLKRMAPECAQARKEWLAAGGSCLPYEGQALEGDVIVDALLGIGARLPLAPPFQPLLAALSSSKKPILALDIPSGLLADTGQAAKEGVHATVTVTFIGLKLGLFLEEGVERCGCVKYDALGVTLSDFPQVPPSATVLTYPTSFLPRRRLGTHKGEQGHVLVIGGGHSGYSGAVCLAGEAALRVGAGLVSAAVSVEALPLMARAVKELMVYGFERSQAMVPLMARATVLLVGPGLGLSSWGKPFLQRALKATCPLVVDADGLNRLTECPVKRSHWVLTPHLKEAARLLNTSLSAIQQDPLEAALQLRRRYGGVIVLKSASTIIVDESDRVFVHPGGLPVLATGGAGDILAGMIAGFIAQKISLGEAAQMAVSIQGEAARLEQELGERGMLASDLLGRIRGLCHSASKQISS